jgi:hypothetical protein
VGTSSFKVTRRRTVDQAKDKRDLVITMDCTKAIPIPAYEQICTLMEPCRK